MDTSGIQYLQNLEMIGKVNWYSQGRAQMLQW